MLNTSDRLPKKVLHVMNSSAGGAALSTLGLIGAFRKQGIESCVVCHAAGSPAERERLREAVRGEVLFTPLYWWTKKIRKPLWKRPLSEMRQLINTGWGRRSSALVTKFAAEHVVDLIHSSTLTTPEGGIAALRLKLPHVWHIRELVGPGTTHPLQLAGPALGQYLAAHCSKLVANSHATAERVRHLVTADLLEIVPNGIDLSRFRYRLRDQPKQPIVVGMVASMAAQWKKHALFIEAATLVERSLPIEWRIYGHDPSRGGTVRGDAYVDSLHDRLAASGIADRFTWPGYVAEPAEVMDQIDVLVHPADSESFGRIVVEGMAAGIPVVGVAGGGVGEIIINGRSGLLSPVDDAAGLAAAIERVVLDPALRASLGQAGREHAQQCYSLEACASRMLEVYRKAMARPVGLSADASRPVGI